MMKEIDFALVWKEEQEKLAEFANLVPDNGTIVEIGTALGGTTKIFHHATLNRGVKIYTIDIMPFQRAYHNLKETGVTIINRPSVECARTWKIKVNRPIDLLYIDGDHNFQCVFEDFNSWLPFMKSGGVVVFHDYDPVERGGLVHFGVRVCLDTIIEQNLLDDIRHDYKLLSGRVKNGNVCHLTLNDCFRTFLKIGKQINAIQEKIFLHSVKSGMKIIKERTIDLDSVQACYCIDHALKKDFECLETLTHSLNDFRRWSETLSIFEHAFGFSHFPNNVSEIPVPTNIIELSHLIAKEQIKITILSSILKTFVDWSP